MNYLKDWNRDNGLAGWSKRGVGLGLVMLAALAGTLGAQDAAMQPGAQPAQPKTNPNVVLAKPSPVPKAMTDDNFALAVERMQTATTAHGTTLDPLHLRYELKTVDVKGKQHTGGFETWNSRDGHRTEIHLDNYNGIEVERSDGGRWLLHDGPRPLRVSEFVAEQLEPQTAIQRSLVGVPSLKAKKVNDATLLCAGDGDTAKVCFDQATGFIAVASVDQEVITYEAWRKIGWKYMAGVVRDSHNNRVILEATMTLASNDVSADVFAVPEGAVQVKSGTSITAFEVPGADLAAPSHPVLSRGISTLRPLTSGGAQVFVWVDEKGKVTKAELEDADDKDIGDYVMDAARRTIYSPYQEKGQYMGFRTSVYFSMSVSRQLVPQTNMQTGPLQW